MKKPGGISGWPRDERPREKLLDRGPHSLSSAELLAIILRSGSSGKSAVDLGRELISEYGTLRNLARRLPKEYSSRRGMGKAKAAQLAAAFELGRRLMGEPREKRARLGSSAEVVEQLMPGYRDLNRELFTIALLDSAHRVIKTKLLTAGTLNAALVHPREVFREAVVEAAAGLILVHNHPSGDPAPSEEDVKLTRQMIRAGSALGIPVVDHVIIGDGRHFSFADAGRMGE